MHLAYVNHKCVPRDDASSTHVKALGLLLEPVVFPLMNVAQTTGSSDPAKEARDYEQTMRLLPPEVLPVSGGLPVYDLVLLGMGSDGHIGSLYPGRPEVMHTGTAWVLPVTKEKPPPSITFSLPVMNAGSKVVVAVTGEKKAQAVRRALEMDEAPDAFPGQRVAPKGGAVWVVDKAAAGALSFAAGA